MSYEHFAILKLCEQYDEFGRVFDPEANLPELAARVHGIVAELCQQRDQLQQKLKASEQSK